MKSARFIIVFCLSLQAKVWAQKTEGNKIRFHSINQFGIIAGASDANLQLQTINGIEKATWFVGIGTGIDYYYSRSIPLFLDIRKNVFSTQKTPFIMLTVGTILHGCQQKMKKAGRAVKNRMGGLLRSRNRLFDSGFQKKWHIV